ncbi:MAG: RidA family protein [Rhizobiales bacterium]|nr:RidA family protein [Hyphomicrobiales bacterium]MBN9010603.1 RidA family protein [Hyphomicrobiales bacterium]
MSNEIDSRLAKLGVTLPTPGAPQASYVPTVRTGNLVFVSGQVPTTPEGVKFVGKLGREYSIEEGQQAARICAINVLANLKVALGGDLGKVTRIVKLVGFVNATPDFTDAHKVINGASDFLIEVLGDKGRHARSAIGMGTLPLGVAVEVEVVAEVA